MDGAVAGGREGRGSLWKLLRAASPGHNQEVGTLSRESKQVPAPPMPQFFFLRERCLSFCSRRERAVVDKENTEWRCSFSLGVS
jgi:hypothetical protein